MNLKSRKKYLQKKYRLPMYLHKKYCLSPHNYSSTKILNKKTRAAIEECESGKCTQSNSLEEFWDDLKSDRHEVRTGCSHLNSQQQKGA